MSSDASSREHFAYLDALRGYAILGVLIVHVGGAVDFVPVTAWGARGVQLFFVVSALTLTASWHARADGAAAFFVRRLFRVGPMFWLAILYYSTQAGSAPHLWQIVASATFVHGLHPESISSIVPGGWSISDEALFYVAFPLLVAVLTGWIRSAVALCVALVIASWWRQHGIALIEPLGFARQVTSDFWFLSMPGQLPAFAAGILAFHTIRRLESPRARRVGEIVLFAALIGLAWQFCYRDVHDVPRVSVLFGIAAAAMGLGAGRYLVNGVISHIGKVSYSAYFIHFALLNSAIGLVKAAGVVGEWAFSVAFAYVAIVTLAFATVTYLLIERPLVAWGREVASRVRDRAALEPA